MEELAGLGKLSRKRLGPYSPCKGKVSIKKYEKNQKTKRKEDVITAAGRFFGVKYDDLFEYSRKECKNFRKTSVANQKKKQMDSLDFDRKGEYGPLKALLSSL